MARPPKVTQSWSIKIGRHRWRVERLAATTIPDPTDPKKRVYGLCYADRRLIQYCGGTAKEPVSRQTRLDTLIHEGIHAILAEYRLEEIMAANLAKLLTAFLGELDLTND